MKRHSLNVFSLVFGVILVLLAASTAFAPEGWWFSAPPWQWQLVLPAAAILLGVALMSPLFTARQRDKSGGNETEDDAAGDPTDPS